MKQNYLFFLISLILSNTSCNNSPSQSSPRTESNTGNSEKAEEAPIAKDQSKKQVHYLKLNKHQIMDREGTGMVAFNCLIPEGWTVRDKLYWEYNDATLPIRYQVFLMTPKIIFRLTRMRMCDPFIV